MDITDLTIASAHRLLAQKKLSVPELVSGQLARIESVEGRLHAFLKIIPKQAMEDAETAQAVINSGQDFSPLLGVPMAHKDVYCTAGVETTAASNILKGYIPPYSATAVERLREAGAIVLGKLNCDAFAHGSSTENSDFGPTKNPYNLEYVPGGSSGGSAAAVAASEVVFATGTDTGGSLRHPAGFCNVVGLKPTYGRVSRFGIIAMASSTDCPGPLTKTVEDCAIVLGAMAGLDSRDSTSSPRPVPDYVSVLGKDIKGWKLGVPKQFFGHGLDGRVEKIIRDAIKKFEELGARAEEIDMPNLDYALAAYYIIMTCEVSSNLARYDGIKYGFSVERDGRVQVKDLLDVYRLSRGQGFGAEAKRRIMLGTYALSAGYYDAYYKKGLQVRELIRRDFASTFEKYDLLLSPVSPTPPFRLGEKVFDPLAMYLSDIYTVSLNMAGVPGLSAPAGFIDDLPVGLQIIGPHFGEGKLLQAAYLFEQSTQLFNRKPKI